MNILIIGSGAREHAIALALSKSPKQPLIACMGTHTNPGILSLAFHYQVGNIANPHEVQAYAKTVNTFLKKLNSSLSLAIIGPETPLNTGVADILWHMDIPCIGPTQELAQIETSKSISRLLQYQCVYQACPEFRVFKSLDGFELYVNQLQNQYVIKADGLRGGKGVKLSGEHLKNLPEAKTFASELLRQDGQFLVEEKLDGEEFSLMSFSDGEHLSNMIPVQDHKRAYEDDQGSNTGGMGSYTDSNHLLPFLTLADVKQAEKINEKMVQKLREHYHKPYKGILYGGFMKTAQGIKLIEYNARFGDPEVMNVLSLLETDLVDIFIAMIEGKLHQLSVRYKNWASVCKYLVPLGYPENSLPAQIIDVSNVINKENLYFADVEEKNNQLTTLNSRAIAVTATAPTLELANEEVQKTIDQITGSYFYRKDIGSNELIFKRVNHMQGLLHSHSNS